MKFRYKKIKFKSEVLVKNSGKMLKNTFSSEKLKKKEEKAKEYSKTFYLKQLNDPKKAAEYKRKTSLHNAEKGWEKT